MGEQLMWAKNTAIYQIYPRSFCDSNGDGIGDLPGATSRLDYLRDLGIGGVWLSPIYASPQDDNGYDISDYRAIAPEYGTMADFEEFLAQAHARGIKVIMDLVVNHTSDEHEWFELSRRRVPGYEDYYIWRDEPNNWGSEFGGPAWRFDEVRGQYYLHIFSPKQPDLNWNNPVVRQEAADVVRFWLDKGVDGFRLDAINIISKPEGFPDDPTGGRSAIPFVINGPQVHPWLVELADRVFRDPNVFTVGETSETTPADAVRYCEALDSVIHFEHMMLDAAGDKWNHAPLELPKLQAVFAAWQEGLQGRGWNSLYLNNHDQPRAVSRFADDSPEAAMMLGGLIHLQCGTPYIYQGEEIGMTNVRFDSIDDYRDVESLNLYRERTDLTHTERLELIYTKGRDNARTPMQWDATPGAGFTTGEPWIGINDNHTTINVAAQEGTEGSVLEFYRALLALRQDYPEIFIDGTFTPLDIDDDTVMAYTRTSSTGRRALVVANFSATTPTRTLPQGEVVLSNLRTPSTPQGDSITLAPWELRVELLAP
ncbi:alpha-glucosidase [Corynebacterium sp. 13CS0277]|uniref:glycoside hydrolase family 13 protein n=1 Tax=Corynebacterium sp. 13CS0277 TaxID=2071994 RepID=UPI0018EB4B7D|nr:alpha-glucosidase [Corynebacterium sp. 13CS0277]